MSIRLTEHCRGPGAAVPGAAEIELTFPGRRGQRPLIYGAALNGAKEVLIFDHTVRIPEREGGGDVRGPVQRSR